MEHESSLPHSQQRVTFLHPQPDQSSPCHLIFWRYILILSSLLRLDFRSALFTTDFPTKTFNTPLVSLKLATCPAYLIFLQLFARIVFVNWHKPWSYLLSNILLLHVTSALPECERPSFTPTWNNRHIWSYAASCRKFNFKHSNGPNCIC
jgi:hypothetical protein